MLRSRPPCGPLRLFVKQLWISDDARIAEPVRERMLPTGTMHVAIRLSGPPIRLYDGAQPQDRGRALGFAVVGGARAALYVRDAVPARSVGAQLEPGAALPLFGAPASALADHHTELDALWGDAARALRDELRAIADPDRCLARFEAALAARLPRVRGIHPAVAHALVRFDAAAARIADVVDEIGYSHRRFITLFRDSVGLTPKRYCRVARFQRVLAQIHAGEPRWGALALDAGYADQAHFTREFTELAGVSPSRYRALAPAQPNHVPFKNLQDAPR